MHETDRDLIKKLFRPVKKSHKGQNGKLTIIGGSKLFHGASLWALKAASRIVDMVFYASVEENKELTKKLKSELYDFIFIPRGKAEEYIKQSDAVLIGPGMVRGSDTGTGETGQETKELAEKLFQQFPQKKWVIDAGALQELEADYLTELNQAIITPHHYEFERLFKVKLPDDHTQCQDLVKKMSQKYDCIIALKGPVDIVCCTKQCLVNRTGNEGMTKGGTGDVLAGLIAALACKNDLFLAASAGLYINGLAGDEIYKRVGPYFNASDLAEEIPKVMKKLLKY